jgi:very-short-patch-repair endonuclease
MDLYGASGRPRLAELAARQHGVVAWWQLRAMGYSARAIARLVACGHLLRIHHGVYAVGHARLSLSGRRMAAVLAGGEGAVLSHRAAGALWDLRRSETGLIDVTVPRSRKGIPRVRFHRVRSLDPEDITIIDGIPVTALARTLLDLAETLRPRQLRAVLEAAERLDLLDGNAIEAMLARNPGRHGLKPLRAALAAHTGPEPWTQSKLERTFLALVREAGLPEPQCNVPLHGELLDFYWPQPPLVVEVDGFPWHKTRRAFESDRRKANKLQLNGIPLLRLTQPRLQYEPAAAISEVRTMLGGGAWGADR